MQAALEHQRARHHAIVNEVAGEEPVVWMNVRLANHNAHAEAPATRIKIRDAMHQLHAAAGQCDRLRQRQSCKRVAKAARQVARAQGLELFARVTFDGAAGEVLPVRRALAGHRFAVERGTHDTLACSQRFIGKETGAAIGHREQRLPVERRFEAEAEQPGIALTEEPVNANVVADHLARSRQAAVEADLGVEQAIHGAAARLKIDAEKTAQEEIRLARFHRDAGRYAPAIEIPGAGAHIVLRHHAAVGHR